MLRQKTKALDLHILILVGSLYTQMYNIISNGVSVMLFVLSLYHQKQSKVYEIVTTPTTALFKPTLSNDAVPYLI